LRERNGPVIPLSEVDAEISSKVKGKLESVTRDVIEPLRDRVKALERALEEETVRKREFENMASQVSISRSSEKLSIK
jgi:ATP-dependent Lon protease